MPQKPLNICFVAPLPPCQGGNGYSSGGIAHWTKMIRDFSASLDDIQITVIDTMPRWRSVHNFPMWKRALSGGFEFLVYTLRLFWLLLTQRIDAIHMTTSGQLGIVRDLGIMFVARIFRKPVIYHIRFGRIPEICEINTREWKLMSRAIMKANTVIALDERTKKTIDKYLPGANTVLIPNCIDLLKLPSASIAGVSRKTVLFIGWVIPTKGIAELLDAWSKTERKGWELIIVGPTDDFYLEELQEKYGARTVKFLGELPHRAVMELMAACDIFVLPSYTEGFPNVVLEAMALGKSIIATNVGAIPEMLDENSGLLIKPKDVESLKQALQRQIDNRGLRAEIGENAREKVLKKYVIDVVFASYMSVWNRAIKKSK